MRFGGEPSRCIFLELNNNKKKNDKKLRCTPANYVLAGKNIPPIHYEITTIRNEFHVRWYTVR